jgi:hypothetical protein
MHRAINPLPQYVFMACCLVKHRDNFTFTVTLNTNNNADLKFLVYGLVRNQMLLGQSLSANSEIFAKYKHMFHSVSWQVSNYIQICHEISS